MPFQSFRKSFLPCLNRFCKETGYKRLFLLWPCLHGSRFFGLLSCHDSRILIFTCQGSDPAFFGLLAVQSFARFFFVCSHPLSFIRRSRLFQPSMRWYQKTFWLSIGFLKKIKKFFLSYYSKRKQAFFVALHACAANAIQAFFVFVWHGLKDFFVPFPLILCRIFFAIFFDQKIFLHNTRSPVDNSCYPVENFLWITVPDAVENFCW